MNLFVLQDRWLMAAVLGGTAMISLLVLSYLAIWRGRTAGDVPPPAARGLPWLLSFMPWLLILTYAGIAVFVILYTVAKMKAPPNW